SPDWVSGLDGWYGRFDLGEQPQPIEYPAFPYASNLVFRREAFLSAGGFPVELGPRGARRIANEEDGLFRRVADRGWTVMYEPRAGVYHWVHAERVSRRYILRRSIVQGRSEVVVDSLFEPSRSRADRLHRAAQSLGGAVGC